MYPILFKIGPLEIRAYGATIAIALLVAFLLLYREAKRRRFHPDKILDLELLILVSGIIGARALHVLVNLGLYKENLLDIFLIWRGGLAFYGALILVLLASALFIARKALPPWKTVDIIAPYAALGHSIGRIGCFLNGCCFGKYMGGGIDRHPAQLYASFALLAIFVILKLAENKKPFNGFVFGLYLLLYSSQRFFLDFWRGDNPTYVFGLTVSQIISVFIFAMGTGLLLSLRGKQWKS